MSYGTEQRIAFIKSLYCPARKVAAETGCSWELILAQAAQEVRWGEKVLPGTNNIFNIKADSSWTGEKRVFHVHEMQNGKKIWVDDPFRVYANVTEALRDRVAFLASNPRYRKAGLFDDGVRGSLEKEAQALQNAGYATDERYADNLVEVFRGRTMRQAVAAAEKEGCCEEKRDWSYPFPATGGKPVDDPGVYLGAPSLPLGALTRACDGHFPVGANGLWHGGIHFDAGTSGKLSQFDGVRCIKDGEVVAYRVDRKYAEVAFPPDQKTALYSTGFALVRHRLELPEAPTKPQPGAAAASVKVSANPARTAASAVAPVATKPTRVLTFYSLYMHLLDGEGYRADLELARPKYWSANSEFTVGEKARDRQITASGVAVTLVGDDDFEEMHCGCGVEYA